MGGNSARIKVNVSLHQKGLVDGVRLTKMANGKPATPKPHHVIRRARISLSFSASASTSRNLLVSTSSRSEPGVVQLSANWYYPCMKMGRDGLSTPSGSSILESADRGAFGPGGSSDTVESGAWSISVCAAFELRGT
jgi:hypothetical protein